MTRTSTPPTEAELRDAYQRAGLAQLGISYEQAMRAPGLRGSLTGMVNSDRRWASTTLRHGSTYLHRIQSDPS